ncbi:MAG: ribonuclease III [Campylobacterota bacterium]
MIEKLEKALDYTFKDERLIIEALTHKSYKKPYNNERLEFLGDAVIDLIVAEFLYFKFEGSDEGILSKTRASIVNEAGLAKLAKMINLGEFLLISNAEENNEGRNKSSLTSNAFEAVMGAIYLESGLKEVERIVIDILNRAYPKIDLQTLSKDYKTALQEITQSLEGVTPEYDLVGSRGPDHKKLFEIKVSLKGKELACAVGKSKKDAQQKAAKIALDAIKESIANE